jgi:3,4-dihydroxy 2-butanone 4-phosphate synthase/GTP cyclohydrolase II
MKGYVTEFAPDFTQFGAAILIDDTTETARAVVVASARQMTTHLMNRLISISNGLPCVAISPERARLFQLEEMARPSSIAPSAPHPIPLVKFCLSVEAREGVTTGISAGDRAVTVAILGEETPNPRKLVKPGHVFPVEVRDGGVLMKTALPEGALDLVRLANVGEAAFFSDLLGADGEFLGHTEAKALAAAEKLPAYTLTSMIEWRLNTECLIERVAEARLPTAAAGELRSIIYRSRIHDGEHVALVKGEINPNEPVLTRVQPEYTLGDVFGGESPGSRGQLLRSLEAIGRRGTGVLVYLRRPAVGELSRQIATPSGNTPVRAAMMREYGIGAQILRDLGVKKVELLSASGRSLAGIQTFGIEITEAHPIPSV